MAVSKTLKYGIVIILFLVVAGGIGSFVFYKHYLPKAIAKSISSDDPEQIKFLPKKMQTKIIAAKKTINARLDEMPETLASLNLTFDDIIYIVDHTDPDEVLKTIDELNNTDIRSTNQIFDIGVKNIKIEGYDLQIFRPVFLEKAKLKDVKKGLKMINDNSLATSISIPVARETVKQILLDKKDKIEAALKKVNN